MLHRLFKTGSAASVERYSSQLKKKGKAWELLAACIPHYEAIQAAEEAKGKP